MPRLRGGSHQDAAGAEARARLSAALRRLDAYSFWVVPSEPSAPGDLVVVGTTGAFLVAACGLPGVVTYGVTGVKVSGIPVPGMRALRRGARQLRDRLHDASVFSSVEPVLVITHAACGAPRTVRGVRVVQREDLVRDLAGRSATLSRSRAQRAARTLGMHIAGDERRHFSAR
jgi:hypothetical protein